MSDKHLEAKCQNALQSTGQTSGALKGFDRGSAFHPRDTDREISVSCDRLQGDANGASFRGTDL